ncbi:MAG: hypothetical protein QME40_00755 [bacterium]|nr:hypothetical protein [bacterium]
MVDDRILALAKEILEDRGKPQSYLEIAALIEANGITDKDCVERFGYGNTFLLAKHIYEIYPELGISKSIKGGETEKRKSNWLMFLRYYSSGLFFAMPMVVMIFAMLILPYSLWTWMLYDVGRATGIGVGTILSFIITGGFCQAIGRRGLFYIHQKEDILTKKVCFRLFRFGATTTILFGLLFLIINLLFGFLPNYIFWYAFIYYLFLSFLWLSLATLYMLKRLFLCTVVIALGILAVHIAFKFFGLDILFSHVIGLSVAIIGGLFFSYMLLQRKAKKAEKEFRASDLPRISMVIYSIFPYFLYGVLYFVFLFLDRVIAWTTPSRDSPYILWFKVQYELGMVWALISLVLTIGVLQYSIEAFSRTVISEQKKVKARGVSDFNQRFINFYKNHLILFLFISILSIIGVYSGMFLLNRIEIFKYVENFFNEITYFVFFSACVGYVFLVWALFNGIFFFALSRPHFIIRAIIPGIICNFVVGFFLSRIFGHHFAVIGLLIGAFVFMIVSSIYAFRVFKHLDYYYYSAF